MNNSEQQYRILQHLGSGAGHHVFKAQDELNSCMVALKIEKSANTGQIEAEIQKLKELQEILGIPKLLDSGRTKDLKFYFTTPLLNKNLQQVIKETKLTLNCILAIGMNLLEILEQVHKRNIIHLDVKPENIMLVSKNVNICVDEILKPGFIQLIDFGLALKIGRNTQRNNLFVGSLRYASRNSHKGHPLGYRDDLESLIYVLIYLQTRLLPWQSLREPKSQQLEIRKIGQMKDLLFNSQQLTQQFPPLFSQFIQYVNKLTTYQMPNYDYLKSIFKQMLNLDKQSPSICLLESDKLFGDLNQEKTLSNVDNILIGFQEIRGIHEKQEEEDLYDTDTSIVFLHDRIRTFNQLKAKLISDIQ